MWFRAVAAAAALAVWSVSGVAIAAGYSEVWNPPEASGHAAKARKIGKAKNKPAAAGTLKAGAKHPSHIAAHGGVKKTAAKGMKGGVKQASGNAGKGGRTKAAVIAQGKKPHTQLVHAKAGQGKVVRADLAHPAHAHAANVAAKSADVKPAAPHRAVPVASANFNSGSADASTNPATASSGSLPPIIH